MKNSPDPIELLEKVAEPFIAAEKQADQRKEISDTLVNAANEARNEFLSAKDTKSKEKFAFAAVDHYSYALSLNPYNVNALIGLAQMSLAGGDKQGAVRFYTNVLKISDNQQALKERAMLFVEMKRYKVAERDLTKIIKDNPKDFEAIGYLGKLYNNQGKHEQALEFLNNVRSKFPNKGEFWPRPSQNSWEESVAPGTWMIYFELAKAYNAIKDERNAEYAAYTAALHKANEDTGYTTQTLFKNWYKTQDPVTQIGKKLEVLCKEMIADCKKELKGRK